MSDVRLSKGALTAAALGLIGSALLVVEVSGDTDLPSKMSWKDSIRNTRHNLSFRTTPANQVSGVIMNPYRNDYNEVCVYCHTPHGANTQIDAPLWNRTFNNNTYTTYDAGGTSTITASVSQPGVASLTCLSCHDGTLGVDSIINMPGSGRYDSNQMTSQSNAFLNQWTNNAGADASVHLGLNGGECLACHSSGAGFVGAGATDFTAAALGTDLRNDHPVGINLPTTRIGVDFVDPNVKGDKLAFFDDDADGRADKNEIRFYKTGDDYRVECASCHDPHGVASGGAGSVMHPTFLRVSNSGSQVCLTCHNL